MRIAIDATCWQNRRGYGRHIRGLLRALIRIDRANQYTLFFDSAKLIEPPPDGCEVRTVHASAPAAQAASADGHRTLPDMWRMSRALSAPEFGAIFFPTIYSYVPVFSRARKLVAVHDVIADTYPELTVPSRMAHLFWNIKVRLGCWQADGLITVSDYSRKGILAHFRVNPKRVFVVGEAADAIFRRLDDPIPGPRLRQAGIDGSRRIVAYLGGFSPHKNLDVLLMAFAKVVANQEFSGVILVMAGEISSDAFLTCFDRLAALVEELGLKQRVIFPGYLSDEDVVVLFNLAEVLVLPSLMEGFGLPAVEAAACGCPVIATKASPLEGLLGGGGLYVNPREDEIVDALTRVLAHEDLRLGMREMGLAAARRLTWDAAGERLAEVIQEVARP